MRSLLLLPLLAFGAACKKQTPPAAQVPAAPAPAGLAAQAGNFGFAARVPAGVELYLGSANGKVHRQALEQTRYWKSLQAYWQDLKPANAAQPAALAALAPAAVDDAFLVVGKGGAAKLAWLRELNRLYSELTYYTLVAGFSAGQGPGKQAGWQSWLAVASAQPDLLERLCALLEGAELPPLMFGFKTDKPEETLRQVLDPAAPPAWLAGASKESFTPAAGGSFTLYQTTAATWLTEAVRQQLQKQLEISVSDPALRGRVQEVLTRLAAKKLSLALGTLDGHVVAAVGWQRAELEFAADPGQSVLARPELAFAAPAAGQRALGLILADAGLFRALHDDQPLAPMLRGALKGLAGSPVFGALAGQLTPKVQALGEAEKQANRRDFATLAGLAWWQDGLHLDVTGGVRAAPEWLGKPLQFGGLLDTPDVLLAAVGHQPPGEAGRVYFEGWMDLLYTLSGALVKSGLGGEQATGMWTLAEQAVVPALQEMYRASRTLYQQALGSESALVVDLKGQMPPLPGVTLPAGSSVLPRFAGVHAVTDRALLASSWQQMQAALTKGMQASPLPLALPEPMSTEKNGVTTWFLPLPVGGNDLMPCASVNDRVYLLGSSKLFNEELAGRLQQPAPAMTGAHLRVNFEALRRFLKGLADGQAAGAPAKANPQAVLPWLAPFQDLRLRSQMAGDLPRTTLEWSMRDLANSYD